MSDLAPISITISLLQFQETKKQRLKKTFSQDVGQGQGESSGSLYGQKQGVHASTPTQALFQLLCLKYSRHFSWQQM